MKQKLVTLCILLALSAPVLAQDFEVIQTNTTPQTLSVQNEFIKLIVNQTSQDMGRFAVETTGGDPENPNDNNQPLIYGRPVPWTSYTTILVDNAPYIFGGESKKLLRRIGKNVTFGSVLSQTQDGSSITTVSNCGPVQAIQRLGFLRNPSTKIKDTALITYEIKNEDSVPHTIGIRIMMDTKLGSNDGAPFRIGNYGITSEVKFNKSDLQDYWQTFDSLVAPNVIAQGTLFLPQNGITPPDDLALVNWGTLVDNPWSFDYEKSRPFIRAGEEENDTALAMYWYPVTIRPGESRIVRTAYGLGGVSLSAGELSVGLTSPSEIYMESQQELLLVGYVSNSGRIDAKNVEIEFQIPRDFEIIKGKRKTILPTLKAKETLQIPIRIALSDQAESGKKAITFKADSDTLESNSISRTIEVIGPPKLDIALNTPAAISNTTPAYATLSVSIKNTTSFTFEKVVSTLITDGTFIIPSYDIQIKTIPVIRPSETVNLNWVVELKNENTAAGVVKVNVVSKPLKPQSAQRIIKIKDLESKTLHKISKPKIINGDYFYLESNVIDTKPDSSESLQIAFDPNQLKLIRISPEPILKNNKIECISTKNSVTINPFTISEKRKEIPVSKIHFKALQTGQTTIEILESNNVKTSIPITIEKE